MVRDFHRKFGFMIDRNVVETEPLSGYDSIDLQTSIHDMMAKAKRLRKSDSVRAQRIGLILEEACETAFAIHDADEIETADGLADLVYVVLGTAVAFSIPLEPVFAEVHRSNMTKFSPTPGDTLSGKSSKGDGFSKADIACALAAARSPLKKCPRCFGSGSLPSLLKDGERCFVCQGKGEVLK